MSHDGNRVALDAIALITLARSDNAHGLLVEALDQLRSRDGEALADMLEREAVLISIMATFAANMTEALNAAGVDGDGALQRMALQFSGEDG